MSEPQNQSHYIIKTEIHEREINGLKGDFKEQRDELRELRKELAQINHKFSAVRNIGYGMLVLYALQTAGLDRAISTALGVPL
jgi:predicted RNase H-like nuclease (RuvC/YqgF family)